MTMKWQTLLLNQVPREGENGGGTPPPKPWYDGKLDAAGVGRLQNLGWHDKSVEEVALAAIKSHQEAERIIGVPKNELLRYKPDDPAIANEFWTKLGRPADAKGYEFEALKGADGKLTNEKLDTVMRETAFKLNLPKDAASQVVKAVVEAQAAEANETNAQREADLTKARERLKQNWGANEAANMLVAKAGAAKLGFSKEEVDAMEKSSSYDKVMEALRRVGALSGEDNFLRNPDNFNGGVMTKEQAQAKINSLKSDKEWIKRWQAGGAAEAREFNQLTTLIASAA